MPASGDGGSGEGGSDGGNAGGFRQAGGPGPHAMLEQEEQRIRHQAVEEFVAVSSQGIVLLRKRGSHDRVDISAAEGATIRGGYLTHNHTRVSAFSVDDIEFACQWQLREIRAVDARWRYVIEPPLLLGRPGWSLSFWQSDVLPAYNRQLARARLAITAGNARRRRGGQAALATDEVRERESHAAWEGVASEIALTYCREVF